jgi:hypothetical protein
MLTVQEENQTSDVRVYVIIKNVIISLVIHTRPSDTFNYFCAVYHGFSAEIPGDPGFQVS